MQTRARVYVCNVWLQSTNAYSPDLCSMLESARIFITGSTGSDEEMAAGLFESVTLPY